MKLDWLCSLGCSVGGWHYRTGQVSTLVALTQNIDGGSVLSWSIIDALLAEQVATLNALTPARTVSTMDPHYVLISIDTIEVCLTRRAICQSKPARR